LINIKHHSNERLATVSEVSSQVLSDIRREQTNNQSRRATKKLISKYQIVNQSTLQLQEEVRPYNDTKTNLQTELSHND